MDKTNPLILIQNNLREVLNPIIETQKTIAKVFEINFGKNSPINKSLENISKYFYEWSSKEPEILSILAENGWFVNWETNINLFKEAFSAKDGKIEILNNFMINHLKQDWHSITKSIITYCPNRVHILHNAFKLHKDKNYIASIPLFLSQSDGICISALKTELFGRKDGEPKTKEKIIEKMKTEEIPLESLTGIFVEPLKIKTKYSDGLSKISNKSKVNAPNRNGILHGYRKCLDYGTEINSLKAFSLLAYIVFILKDLIEIKYNKTN